MSSAWPKVPFETIYVEPSKNGVYKSAEFHGSGAKIVNMGELFGYEFIGSQEMKRIQMTAAELEKSGLINGDLLFGRRSLVEAGAGKCSIVKALNDKTTFESSLIRVRLDQSEALPEFYYYWFKSHVGRAGIKAIVTGTNVKGIKSSNLKKVMVAKPDLVTQRAIVDLISKYDDLIENNKRRIELLEDSARQLYKEWFVRFRFPGHEHVKIIDGVPDGWKFYTYGDISETVGGGTPSTGVIEYWEDGDITWFVPKDLTQNDSLVLLESEKKITKLGLQKSSAKLLPPNTIMMSSRASIGYFGLYDGIACTNQGFISVIPNDANAQMYLLYNLMSRKEEIIGLAGGTTYKEINKTTFRAIPVLMPPSHLLIEFQDWAKDAINQVRLLMKQKKQLVKARDLLLPKLMSGELAV